ncbi:cytochrome P450 monooxygenase [Pyrenophora tritici-repentis]|nr:cytochrome P450 monooxygenase [Pyrenophora tritici-repentis]KAI2479982.1 cytochrome P450 monooxygenase [Pyrenophora tritici-repentis]
MFVPAKFIPAVLFLCQLLVSSARALRKISFVSYGISFHSRYAANVNFMTNAVGVIGNGYDKFRETAFQFLRSDADIIVLPPSVVQELSTLPPNIADGTKALEHDLMGPYTGLNFILQSRLHHRIVQRKLTPNLGLLTPHLEDELGKAVEDLFPEGANHGWTEVKLYPLLLSLTARTSARAFVGTSFCRDSRWLNSAVNFVEDLFRTVVILRAFPSWLHPVVCVFMPSYWRGKGYFRSARQVLGPYIQERLEALDQGKELREAFVEPSALNWLVDIAEGDERNLARLAHTETVLSLAGIHTMLLRQLSIIYDLTAHPEYLEGLRAEIADLSAQWNKASYSQLRKLDSFMRESQRLAPPTVLGLKRIMQQAYILQDGTLLPKGAYVCVAAYAIENDPRIYTEPEKFDGLRSFLQSDGTDSNKHTFAATDTTVLGFGHGKTACPGRFFASLVIKMSVIKLITEYEFEFLPGKGRPKNWMAHEFLFASPWDRIRMRRREVGTCPF